MNHVPQGHIHLAETVIVSSAALVVTVLVVGDIVRRVHGTHIAITKDVRYTKIVSRMKIIIQDT